MLRFLLAICLLSSTWAVYAQDAAAAADLDAGKSLFQANCAACHAKDMKSRLTGPALGGVEERWSAYPREDLYKWVRNSQSMIKDHPRAKELWAEWGPVVMNNFLNLTDQDIENLLGYIDGVYKGTYGPKVGDGGDTKVAAEPVKTDNTPMFIALVLVLAVLAVVLARILSNLSYLNEIKAGNMAAQRRTLVEVLTSRGVIGFVIFALVVLGGYTTVNNAIMLGRQQGYQPEQPIKFSHATHAGLQKIDCQYCHDGARRSKHSVIPAANTCMNCHKAIKVGSQYGTAELTKIYASVGYDPSTDKYIENYANMSEADIEKVYKKWIADTQVSSGGSVDEAKIQSEWDGIVAALTNPESGDKKVYGPIEWVRLHNLPDHAYFNHAQHVTVGKVACQTCHGAVEEMEVVYQYSPLSMGWCVNCHRETEVKFADNEYYKSYQVYHKQIQDGERTKVTVEDIGGLECQKCHY
jgi:cytochrome c2